MATRSRSTTRSSKEPASAPRSSRASCIRRHGASNRETFTVRKISFGVGVERTFPVHSPKIDKIEILSHGKVRRSKLYFLRDKVGKAARLKEKGF